MVVSKETLPAALPADTGWGAPVAAAAATLGTGEFSLYAAMQRTTAAAAITPTTATREIGLASDRITAAL
jgi:hypothetical protein